MIITNYESESLNFLTNNYGPRIDSLGLNRLDSTPDPEP